MKELLELKKRLNAKRPAFNKTDSYKHKRLTDNWRRPKGIHNKMRHQRWGKAAIVKVGYRNPVAVRHLTLSGLLPVLVYAVSDLQNLDVKKHGVIIGHVGGKLKIKLLDECKKQGLSVINVKDIDAKSKQLKAVVEERKKIKAESASKKVAEAPKPEPKADEAKSREEEQKEMEKLLTKRN